MNIFVDVAVVGAGPYGILAAEKAARAGKKCVVFDSNTAPGGHLLSGCGDVAAPDGWLARKLAALKELGVIILPRTTVTGWYDDRFLTALETVTGYGPASEDNPRERLWRVRTKSVVLATGAIERPLTFARNDLPGIMLADSIRTYAVRYAVLAGSRVVIATNNDNGYRVAVELCRVGGDSLHSVNVVDCRAATTGGTWKEQAGKQAKITIHSQSVIAEAKGHRHVRQVVIQPVADPDAVFVTYSGQSRTLACDAVGMSGGFTPTLHLLSQSGVKLDWNGYNFVAPHKLDGDQVTGAAAGIWSMPETGKQTTFEDDDPSVMSARIRFNPDWGHTWQFVDFQNDVKLSDLALSRREGYSAVEHAKRYTTTGMATDQGKTSNLIALQFLAALEKKPVDKVGHTTFRPPYIPLTFGAVAAPRIGSDFRPVRTTSLHRKHIALGAVFEDVGEWKRPHYYPKAGESMQQAVTRECLAVRGGVGIFDGSTLGKIELHGADVAWFLNWIYTNRWDKLAVNRCRYGIMLNENGMIFDDGVTTRLAEDHYYMTTTTGGAATVMNWLEEWAQTEWPEREILLTSVSEQSAVVALAGPESRAVLSALTDAAIDPESLPFMSMCEAEVAGIPARIFRISFSGELAFEINVPSRQASTLWNKLMEAGASAGITPYGTETMHVLRAEKGFIIVGQDTDTTCTPADMGLNWMIAKSKHDFLGYRSLSRSGMSDPNRKQLVGFETGISKIIPEGCPLIDNQTGKATGFVTSSYLRPHTGLNFGLAMVSNGRQRMGGNLDAVVDPGQTIPIRLCNPVFYDPENTRQR